LSKINLWRSRSDLPSQGRSVGAIGILRPSAWAPSVLKCRPGRCRGPADPRALR